MRERHVAPVAADVGEQFEKWEVMLDVPDEIGEEYQESDQAAEPDPRLKEHRAMLSKQQARYHAGGEEDDAIFVLKRYARDRAKPQPQFLVARLDDPDQHQSASRPGQRFEGVHRNVVAHREADPGGEDGQRGERLRKSLAAEFAGDPSGEKHRARAGQRRKEPDRLQGVAEEQPLDSYEHRDERWLVDVAPRQVSAARHEVQFVAEISIEAPRIEMNRELGESDVSDDGRPAGEALSEGSGGRRCSGGCPCFGQDWGHRVSFGFPLSFLLLFALRLEALAISFFPVCPSRTNQVARASFSLIKSD